MLNLLGSHDTPRFLTLCQGNRERSKVTVAFLFTYVGVPMIYYGDEVGMAGENDPDCRRPMVWDTAAQDQEFLEWHRQLIRIRKAHPALRRGTIHTVHASGDVYAFERQHGVDYVLTILNRGATVQTIRLPDKCWRDKPSLRDALSGRIYTRSEPIEIRASSAQVLVVEPVTA
jgi:glycosidase